MANLYVEVPEKELLLKIKEGDELAFREIYNRFWSSVHQTAYDILRDGDAAKDIVQEVFISFWNRREEIEIRSLKSYLHQATRYGVFKAIRAQRVDEAFYERLKTVTIDIITDEPLLFKEQSQLIQSLMEELPDDCREIFRLNREDGLTYRQIAALLGISEKTVEKKISKVLQHLRKGMHLAVLLGLATPDIFSKL